MSVSVRVWKNSHTAITMPLATSGDVSFIFSIDSRLVLNGLRGNGLSIQGHWTLIIVSTNQATREGQESTDKPPIRTEITNVMTRIGDSRTTSPRSD